MQNNNEQMFSSLKKFILPPDKTYHIKRNVLLKQGVLDTKIKFISDFTEGQ